MKTLKVKLMRENARLPVRATEHSAGVDLCVCVEQPLRLPAQGSAVAPSGVAVELEPGYVGLVFGRSGLGVKHGIAPSNAVGVIDSDYRGEILIGLTNHSQADYTIRPGERIAQLVVVPVALPEPVLCEELSGTGRGAGGFGSTGKE